MPPSPVRSRFVLLTAALCFSTGGAAFKLISMNGWQVASFRSGIAALVMLAVLPEARRGWNWSIVPVALAYAATLISFVVANKLTTAANAIFLQSTAPLYLLLLGPLVLREPLRRADLLYMAGVLVGVTLFFVGSEAAVATAPDPRRGNIIALGSGVVYALMLAGLRWLARHGEHKAGSLGAAALGNILACVCALPWALPVSHASARDVVVLVYLGTIQIGLAYVFLTRGLRHIQAVEATSILMVEPAMNPVWSWLVHDERPAPFSLLGGALILLASLVNTIRRR